MRLSQVTRPLFQQAAFQQRLRVVGIFGNQRVEMLRGFRQSANQAQQSRVPTRRNTVVRVCGEPFGQDGQVRVTRTVGRRQLEVARGHLHARVKRKRTQEGIRGICLQSLAVVQHAEVVEGVRVRLINSLNQRSQQFSITR